MPQHSLTYKPKVPKGGYSLDVRREALMPTLKEQIENNLTVVLGGFLVAGFAAGFTICKEIEPLIMSSKDSTSSGAPSDWTTPARQAGWLSSKECPAYPVSINILNPGNGSEISASQYSDTVYFDLVIQASRPMTTDHNAVGIVTNYEGEKNLGGCEFRARP